jgi:mannose-6-phosphate isomerase-like protein (cupin superfamily)
MTSSSAGSARPVRWSQGGDDSVANVLDAAQSPTNVGNERVWGFRDVSKPHLNGRSIDFAMGKVLGSGFGNNSAVWARGHRRDSEFFVAGPEENGLRSFAAEIVHFLGSKTRAIGCAVTVDSHNVMRLPASPTVEAPDGSDVRVLLSTSRGSCAHFDLAGGQTSTAVAHTTVEEIWCFLSGRGQMWLASADSDGDVAAVMPGDGLTIIAACSRPAAVAVMMPPWPGENEASGVEGRWESSTR